MTEKQINPENDNESSIGDDLLEVAVQGELAEANGRIVAEAFRDFQDGKISGDQYTAISEYYGFDEGTAKNAARAANERINNEGQALTPAQHIGRWLTRRR